MVNHTKSIIPQSVSPQPLRIYSEYLMVRTGKMLRNRGNNHEISCTHIPLLSLS